MPYTHAGSHYHLLRMKEMGKVYWCHSIGATGNGLVSIFVPIFLLKVHYSFRQVLIFLILQQVFSLIIQYPMSRLLTRIRPHKMMAAGQLLSTVMFGLLATLTTHHWPLAVIALAWSLNRTAYWMCFHYIFSLVRAHKTGGRQVAGLSALIMCATTVAPAVGGILATRVGINASYIVAIALLVIGVMPLLFTKERGPETVKIELSRAQLWEIRRDMLAQFMNGTAVMAEGNLWPLFVFLLISSYAGIGALSSAIAVASVIITLYVGKRQEIKGERYYIKRGLATASLVNFGRVFAQTTPQIFGLNLLSGVSRSLYITPFLNRYYTNSDGSQRLGYVIAMEMSLIAGSACHVGLLIILSYFFAAKIVLTVGLVVAGLGVLGLRLIR